VESSLEVRKIIASRDGDYWETVLSDADCCCTIVKSVSEALADAQFRDRGVLDHLVENESGERILATPVPIASCLRIQGERSRKSPQLGEHNEELLG
jgi:alpha-methylacyl-CoA racemase